MFDDFMIGPQIDELEVNEFDLDFEDVVNDEEFDEDEEFYEDGSELFSSDLSNIEGTIDDILEDLDLNNPDEKDLHDKLLKVKDDKETLEDIRSVCIDRVCDSDTICHYISDYTIYELGDMDGIWNEFGDILRETIYEYFGFLLE
jgi:hypothetical protein